MPRLIGRIISAIGNAVTLWGLLPTSWQTIMTLIASVATGYFSFRSNGIAVAIVAASAVFAFSMLGIFMWIGITRLTSVYERLIVESLGISTGHVNFDKDGRNHTIYILRNLSLKLILRNHSPQQTIYFRLKRVHHSIGTATVSGVPKVSSLINIIPPGGIAEITLQTLPDVTLTANLIGHIDIEIQYGDNKEKLQYLLMYQSAPALGVIVQKKMSHITINAPIIKHLHVRVPRYDQKQLVGPTED